MDVVRNLADLLVLAVPCHQVDNKCTHKTQHAKDRRHHRQITHIFLYWLGCFCNSHRRNALNGVFSLTLILQKE